MNNLDFTLNKIESLAKQPPDQAVYDYLFGWMDDWKIQSYWWNRLKNIVFRHQSMIKRPIYRAVLMTLAKIETEPAFDCLKKFYNPRYPENDREAIKDAVVSFFYKEYFDQPVDMIDFAENEDTLSVSIIPPEQAEVVFSKFINDDFRLCFDVLLKKKSGYWLVYEVKEKK